MILRLQPKQAKLYHLLKATGLSVPTVVGAGGAKGSGKSKGARSIALRLASELGNQYPGIVITLVRRVASDLRDNHIEPMFRDHPELYQYWRATDHDLILHNKARIIFRSVERSEDVRKRFLGGFESAIIIVDEAQQFSEEELQWIQTAARWTNAEAGIPAGLCKTLLLFNPGGPGSKYIRRIFWLKDYKNKEKPHNYAFIHMFGWDNYEWFRGQSNLTESEFYQLRGNCGESGYGAGYCCRFHIFIRDTKEGQKYDQFPQSIRAGYLMGSFDDFEGQYFAGAWGPECVISTQALAQLWQPWWTHWMSTDWGWAGPPRPHYSVNLWFSIGKISPTILLKALGIHGGKDAVGDLLPCDYPLDVIICWQERHANLTPEPDFAQTIVDATPLHLRESISRHFVDGAMFSKDRRSENTTADLMQPILSEAGLPRMIPADKDRIGGWRQLYNAFVRTVNARRRPVTEPLEGPLLLVAADCAELARSVPLVICDPDRPEDVLKTEQIEDDYMDTLRYGYKSMQAAQWEAPVEVRRQELYQEYDVPSEQRTMSQMTTLSMKMRLFDADERKRYKRVKRRR